MPRVLISDDLSPRAVEIFKERGVEVDDEHLADARSIEAGDRQI